jgi:hypothetical protein
MSTTLPPTSEQEARAHWDLVLLDIDRRIAEARKLNAESVKLTAEARKLRWDPFLLALGAIIAGAFLRLPEILHAFGAN